MHTTNLPRLPLRALDRASKWVVVASVSLTTPVFAQQHPGTDQAPTTPEVQWNKQLLGSGQVEQVSATLARSHKTAADSVDESMIDKMKRSLPSLNQLGSSLKYGSFSVVSSQGPEVIALVRTIPMLSGTERRDALTKLWNFGRQGVPEAQNFVGFVYEYGVFGVPQNMRTARAYYTAAASRHYQAAMLNLATIAYFGKDQTADQDTARELVRAAADVGVESSGRVCGLASFIEYRRGNVDAALRSGKFCYSALANIPNAAYGYQLPLAQRVKMLRDSIGSGAPDGYRWLEEITQKAGPDPEFLYCKYRLINRLRTAPTTVDLKTLARTCYENSARSPGAVQADNAVQGIVGFVVTEQRQLEQMRQSNRFHYAWSVPYLPFSQGDVDLFEPVVKGTK